MFRWSPSVLHPEPAQWHHSVMDVRAQVLTIQVYQLSKLRLFHHPMHAHAQMRTDMPMAIYHHVLL